MEDNISKLLEILGKHFPEIVTIEKVREEFANETPTRTSENSQDITFFERTLEFALDNDFIIFKDKQSRERFNEMRTKEAGLKHAITNSPTSSITLSALGFELLNQIKLKSELEKLSKTIEAFSSKSKQEAKELNRYTWIIALLTLVVVANGIAAAFFNDPVYAYLAEGAIVIPAYIYLFLIRPKN